MLESLFIVAVKTAYDVTIETMEKILSKETISTINNVADKIFLRLVEHAISDPNR